MTVNRIKNWREAAYKRQAGLCYWCDQPMLIVAHQSHPQFCTAEHLTAKRDGGRNWNTNIVAACFWCNNHRHRKRRSDKRHAK